MMSAGLKGHTIQEFNFANIGIKNRLLLLDNQSTLNLVHDTEYLENL